MLTLGHDETDGSPSKAVVVVARRPDPRTATSWDMAMKFTACT